MRLLIVGQGSRHTGYARVLRTLAVELAHEFDVFFLCLMSPAPPALAGVRYIAPLLRSDPYGLAELPAVLSRVRPDVVLACHDPQILAAQTKTVRAHGGSRIVLYLPLEWQEQDPSMLRELASADRLVCYTDTARRWIQARTGLCAPILSEPIPHGVDRQVFGPVDAEGLPDRRAGRAVARAAARRLLGLGDRETVVLNANRDTPRKRLGTTLQAFALVADKAPDTRLILTHGQRLRDDARRPSLRGRVLIPDRPPDTDTALNHYYNSADVGLNTCTAEGWGMVAFEHAAAGVAQVMPGHPALREIWGSAAGFVPVAPSAVDGYGPVDPADVAEVLLPLCRDREQADRLGRRARDRARSAEFDWAGIARRWSALLRDTVAGSGC
ncbi:glycosyltransferase family 4 protein [Streptomyces sp. NPDC093094]|uniref:glycosyltransferase family 4 protein n=1 Tax=Streptomyces sp. NPDC093094 TaxID=3366026 RepID=UPI0038226E1F